MSNLIKTSSEIRTLSSNLTLEETAKKDFDTFFYESKLSEAVATEDIPAEFVKEFDSGDKTGVLEYLSEEYIITRLNKWYPGWWNEDMKRDYNLQLRIAEVFGYLCVKYPTPRGFEVRKIWAVGAERIHYEKKGDSNEPSQPEDRIAAARTRWLKLTAKWLGIGLDIYTQRITDKLKQQFEDRIMPYREYAEEFKSIAKTITKGHGMRNLIKRIPPVEITEEFSKLVNKIPDSVEIEGESLKVKLWKTYAKHRYDIEENKKNLEAFVEKVRSISNKYNKE